MSVLIGLRVHIQNPHATGVHLRGLNYERVTFNYEGRSFRGADVYANVVRGILI